MLGFILGLCWVLCWARLVFYVCEIMSFMLLVYLGFMFGSVCVLSSWGFMRVLFGFCFGLCVGSMWVSVGFYLELIWVLLGFYAGFMLDFIWILFGFYLDFTLFLCLVYVGFDLCFVFG